MTPRDIVRAQIEHRETEVIPYTLGFEGDVAERLDQHYGGTAWRQHLSPYIRRAISVDRRRAVEVEAGINRDLFGTTWRLDRRPFHLETPGMPEPSFDGVSWPTARDFVDPDFVAQGCEGVRRNAGYFTTIGLGWGLWECSWGIRGFENALMDAATEPDFFEELLDRLTQLYLDQLELCRDIPADGIMFGDDWGDQRGVMIGPDRWRRFLKPRYAQIYQAAHDQGKLVLSHCCGSIADIIPDAIEIRLDVLESVQPEAAGMNPYQLKRRYGDRLTFWGGLGSQSTIPFGTPAAIRAEVDRLRAEMGRGGGYILAPAKGLQPETPTENAAAVVEAFTGWGGAA